LNKNGFKQLPVELVQQILGELIRNRSSASEALRDLGSIQLTSRDYMTHYRAKPISIAVTKP
jgi:hypothetical protein